MGQFRAGSGRVSVTPAIGAWLVGFAGRAGGCTAIHDELYATALVLDDGDRPIAILSCDLISIHPDLIHETRMLVHEATGIREDHVMICCTHTHSGPPGYATERSRPIDQAYAAYLPYRLAGAVRLAWDDRAPARLGHDSGEVTIAINRREVVGQGQTILGENPDGPVDPVVGLLRVDRADGTPLATLLNYVCHPVILGPKSLVVSADFVGRTRAVVEAATGSSMLYIQGACGDINPLGGVQADYANCYRLGTILAGEVVRVYGGIDPGQTEIDLAARVTEIEVPLAPLGAEPRGRGGTWDIEDRLDKEFPWAANLGPGGARIEIQTLRIGDLGIVSVASEPFVETGLAVKAGSPFERAFFAGYTNGCIGYVPTAQAYPYGGYEVLSAHAGYRLPTPVAPAAEQMVVQACADALKQANGS